MASLNVTVTLNVLFTGSGAAEVILTVGTVASYVRLSCAAAVLALPAASFATPAFTSTVTVPSTVGVISAV